ncbi:MAG: ABC transporter permease, partial [Gemmatimonadota bacterium]
MAGGRGNRGGVRLVRVAERLFRLVLRLLPARLRERHGEEMAVDLRRLANRGRARSGAAGVAFVLVRACADVVMQAPVEHWREVTGADGTGSRHGARRERAGAVETVAADGYRALRLAVRALARRPGFAVVVVLTLGVGIGATAASFAVVRSVLIEPLPYPDSERIVMVEHHAPGLHLMESLGASPGMVDFYRGSAQSFSHMAIIRSRAARNLTGDERPARVRVVEASPDVFAVLGVRPARGRAFGGVDIEPGAEPVAVLTHAGWRSHFGGDEDVVGRTVELGGIPTRIVGIMPEGFHYPDPETVALLPRSVGPEPAFGDFGIGAIARLAPDVTLEEARREVAALQRRIPDVFPDEMTSEFLERSGWRASVVPLRDLEVRDVESTLWIVLGTVGFVLLIACAGVANLFLVRMDGRRAEFAVRAALGAGRARLAGLFASEGVLLGLGGGIVGGALSVAGVRAIVAAEPPGLPRLHEIAVEPATVGCVVGLGVVAGLALGLLPFARMAGAIGDGGALPQARGGIGAPERQRTRRVLIAGQVALALVLLTGSG